MIYIISIKYKTIIKIKYKKNYLLINKLSKNLDITLKIEKKIFVLYLNISISKELKELKEKWKYSINFL